MGIVNKESKKDSSIIFKPDNLELVEKKTQIQRDKKKFKPKKATIDPEGLPLLLTARCPQAEACVWAQWSQGPPACPWLVPLSLRVLNQAFLPNFSS